MDGKKSRRASALVFVVAILMALSTIGIAFVSLAVVEQRASENLAVYAHARLGVYAGMDHAVALLYQCFCKEEWYQNYLFEKGDQGEISAVARWYYGGEDTNGDEEKQEDEIDLDQDGTLDCPLEMAISPSFEIGKYDEKKFPFLKGMGYSGKYSIPEGEVSYALRVQELSGKVALLPEPDEAKRKSFYELLQGEEKEIREKLTGPPRILYTLLENRMDAWRMDIAKIGYQMPPDFISVANLLRALYKPMENGAAFPSQATLELNLRNALEKAMIQEVADTLSTLLSKEEYQKMLERECGRIVRNLSVYGWKDPGTIKPPGQARSSKEEAQRPLEIEPRSPINLNTASYEVLVSCLCHLKARMVRPGFVANDEEKTVLEKLLLDEQYCATLEKSLQTSKEARSALQARREAIKAGVGDKIEYVSLGPEKAKYVARNIVARRHAKPFSSWKDFAYFLTVLMNPDSKEKGREDLWTPEEPKRGPGKNGEMVWQEARIQENDSSIPWMWKSPSEEADLRISAQEASMIWANANPNTNSNKCNPDFPDAFLYQLWWGNGGQDDKLFYRIDKADMEVYTTEFCFQPTGYFEISALARMTGHSGEPLTTVNHCMIAKIFEMERLTSQRDFKQGAKLEGSATYPEIRPPDSEVSQGQASKQDGYVSLAPVDFQVRNPVPTIQETVPKWKKIGGEQKKSHLFRDGSFGDADNIPTNDQGKFEEIGQVNMLCFWYKPNWDVKDPCARPHSIMDANGTIYYEEGTPRHRDRDKKKLFQLYNEHKAISPQIEDPDRARWSMFVWDYMPTEESKEGRPLKFTFMLPDGLSQNRWIFYTLRWTTKKMEMEVNGQAIEIMQPKTHACYIVTPVHYDVFNTYKSIFQFVGDEQTLSPVKGQVLDIKNMQYLHGDYRQDRHVINGFYKSSTYSRYLGETWQALEYNSQYEGAMYLTAGSLFSDYCTVSYAGKRVETSPLPGGVMGASTSDEKSNQEYYFRNYFVTSTPDYRYWDNLETLVTRYGNELLQHEKEEYEELRKKFQETMKQQKLEYEQMQRDAYERFKAQDIDQKNWSTLWNQEWSKEWKQNQAKWGVLRNEMGEEKWGKFCFRTSWISGARSCRISSYRCEKDQMRRDMTEEERREWTKLLLKNESAVTHTSEKQLAKYEIDLLPKFEDIYQGTFSRTINGVTDGFRHYDSQLLLFAKVLSQIKNCPAEGETPGKNLVEKDPGNWPEAYRKVLQWLIRYGRVNFKVFLNSIAIKPKSELSQIFKAGPSSRSVNLGGPLKYLKYEGNDPEPAVYTLTAPSQGTYAGFRLFNNLPDMDYAKNLAGNLYEQGRYHDRDARFSAYWNLSRRTSQLGGIRWTEYCPQDCRGNRRTPEEAEATIELKLYDETGIPLGGSKSKAEGTPIDAMTENFAKGGANRLRYEVNFLLKKTKGGKKVVSAPILDDITLTYYTGWQCLEWR